MTAEEVFSDLYEKYGADLNWYMIPLTQSGGAFVSELKEEIGTGHFLYDKGIWAVAKCESDDDVLYVTGNEDGTDSYYVFHWADSEQSLDGSPKCKELADIHAVKEYIEQSIIKNAL